MYKYFTIIWEHFWLHFLQEKYQISQASYLRISLGVKLLKWINKCTYNINIYETISFSRLLLYFSLFLSLTLSFPLYSSVM